jgi:phage I-like protein
MSQNFGYYADLGSLVLGESDYTGWIHAMRPGKYTHPEYGELDLSVERLTRFADSVTTNVRGIELDIDYDHKLDVAKGSQAAGWIKGAEVRPDGTGLWLKVAFTKDAYQDIKSKKYKYFSPEFVDEWVNPQGQKFQDVLNGGGITNRPFLKDLLPLNLSELSFGDPVEESNNDPQDKGDEVDMKKLREVLGLAETSTDEEVYKAFGEKLNAAPPTPPVPPKEDPKPEPPKYTLGEDLRRLAETNPAVKDLLGFVEQLVETNKENAKELRETAVTARLNELDTSSLVMVKAAKDLAHDIAMALSETKDQDKFFSLLSMMRDNQGVLVELGERGKSHASGYVRDRSAEASFNELVTKKMSEDKKLGYADAVELVAAENHKLYAQYREEVRLVKTA